MLSDPAEFVLGVGLAQFEIAEEQLEEVGRLNIAVRAVRESASWGEASCDNWYRTREHMREKHGEGSGFGEDHSNRFRRKFWTNDKWRSMGNMQGDITDRWYLGRWSLPFLAPPHPSPNPTNASLYAEGLTLVAFTTTGIISPVASGYG